MTTALAAGPTAATNDLDPVWSPITVPMFQAMMRTGIVGEEEPVYLWKGRLARRMAPNRDHSIAVDATSEAIRRRLDPGHHVMAEQPLARRLEDSMPQPDVAVVRGRSRDYRPHFPTTADAALVVEVADTSLAADRAQEVDNAREGVPIYWIVNLRDRRVEVFEHPAADGYRRTSCYAAGDAVPLVIDGRVLGRIPVSDILP